jgi:dihydroneopterin aldolase
MDKIIIQDFEVYAYHGVAPEEKEMGQMFLVCLEIVADLENAACMDRLDLTVNYSKVCSVAEEILTGSKYDLLETAALAVIRGVLERFPKVMQVKVLLKKPWAPMGRHLKYAAVEMERVRKNETEGN